jgi:NADPH2:quinone reductase
MGSTGPGTPSSRATDTAADAAAEDINAAIVDGALTVGEEAGLPLHRVDLAHTADAHALVESGIVGKVLIDVSAA